MDAEIQNLVKILSLFIINHKITIDSIVSHIFTKSSLDKKRLIVLNHISKKYIMYKEIPTSSVLLKIQHNRSDIIIYYIKVKDIEKIITSYDTCFSE